MQVCFAAATVRPVILAKMDKQTPLRRNLGPVGISLLTINQWKRISTETGFKQTLFP